MRLRVELALRIAGLAAIVAWLVTTSSPSATRVERAVSTQELASALRDWTRHPGALDAQVVLDSAPDRLHLDWLAALQASGARVSWSSSIPDVAVETYAPPDPEGATVILAGGRDRAAVVGDALGPMDTLAGSEAVRVGGAHGDISVRSGAQAARAVAPVVSGVSRALVVASAGWEGKFVAQALEERGWKVDARMLVAPGHDVVPPTSTMLDTARYAVVVLLDSAAAETIGGAERFVRDGGGAVLGGDASNARTVRGLVAWRAGAEELAPLGTAASDTLWRGSSRRGFRLAEDAPAIVLERRAAKPIVVARRYFAGRVVAVGYDQTWRWRMQGGADGRVQHRAWWSRVVSSAALRRSQPTSPSARLSAPLASVMAALGPSASAAGDVPSSLPDLRPLFAALALVALLGEWLLRRLRGGT